MSNTMTKLVAVLAVLLLATPAVAAEIVPVFGPSFDTSSVVQTSGDEMTGALAWDLPDGTPGGPDTYSLYLLNGNGTDEAGINTLPSQSGVTWVTGIDGQAMSSVGEGYLFKGPISDYSSLRPLVNASFSVDFWAKDLGDTCIAGAGCDLATLADPAWGLFASETDNIQVRLTGTATGVTFQFQQGSLGGGVGNECVYEIPDDPGTAAWDTWHHLAVTVNRDGIDDTVKLYVNGVVVSTCTFFTEGHYSFSATPVPGSLIVGQYLDGKLDNVRVTSKVLAAIEVAGTHADAGVLPAGAPAPAIEVTSGLATVDDLTIMGNFSCLGTNCPGGMSQTTADGRYVLKTGDEMTGTLFSPSLVVQRPTSSSPVNLQEWRNFDDTVLAFVDKDGAALFSGGTTTTGLRVATRAVAASGTATAGDFTIMCNATGGAVAIDVSPLTAEVGRHLRFIKTDTSANQCSFTVTGSNIFDPGNAGATNTFVRTPSPRASCTIQSDGTNWYVVSGQCSGT